MTKKSTQSWGSKKKSSSLARSSSSKSGGSTSIKIPDVHRTSEGTIEESFEEAAP